jgi:hypothetical protein
MEAKNPRRRRQSGDPVGRGEARRRPRLALPIGAVAGTLWLLCVFVWLVPPRFGAGYRRAV